MAMAAEAGEAAARVLQWQRNEEAARSMQAAELRRGAGTVLLLTTYYVGSLRSMSDPAQSTRHIPRLHAPSSGLPQ